MRVDKRLLIAALIVLGMLAFIHLFEKSRNQPSVDTEPSGLAKESIDSRSAVRANAMADGQDGLVERHAPKKIQGQELFAAKSWYVAPVVASPPPINVAPAPVTAPVLPYGFIGRLINGSEITVFLSRSGKQYAVKNNDTLDDEYRVGSVTATEIVLIHLPTNTEQTIRFNSTAIGSSILRNPAPEEAGI